MTQLTQKEKIGGFLNGAQRELASQKAQANPDQNAIAISEREVQRWQNEYDRFPKRRKPTFPISRKG